MAKKIRKSTIERQTSETDIRIELDLDGKGQSNIETGIPFFDHMLTLLAKHGLFNISIEAKGDLEIDDHHTVEDVGICLGQAFKDALGELKGIKRYGDCLTPMDEALSRVAIDISGRPKLFSSFSLPQELIGAFDPILVNEFLTAFVNQAGLTLHIDLLKGDNNHHAIESIFKGLGRALDIATSKDARQRDIPSTKGKL